MTGRWPWRGGRKRAVTLIERAIGEVCPEVVPATACCLWAAGARALAQKGRIMAGAFVEVLPNGCLRGWGVNGTQLALGRDFIPDTIALEASMGPDGKFAGHVWLEMGKTIVDVPNGFSGSLTIHGQARVCMLRQRGYLVVPKLASSIRIRWGAQMKAVAAHVLAAR